MMYSHSHPATREILNVFLSELQMLAYPKGKWGREQHMKAKRWDKRNGRSCWGQRRRARAEKAFHSISAVVRGMIKRGQRERNAYCLIGTERADKTRKWGRWGWNTERPIKMVQVGWQILYTARMKTKLIKSDKERHL